MTKFAFLTAQNYELTAQENLWCVQLIVLGGFCYMPYTQRITPIATSSRKQQQRKRTPFAL